jgi:nitrite reductase (NO-forming)
MEGTATVAGGTVRFAEDGLYPIITHAFNFAGKGALGLFSAGNGGPPVASGH